MIEGFNENTMRCDRKNDFINNNKENKCLQFETPETTKEKQKL